MLINEDDLKETESFRKLIPGLRHNFNVPQEEELELWALRSLALREARRPAGFFFSLLKQPAIRWHRPTKRDFAEAQRAMHNRPEGQPYIDDAELGSPGLFEKAVERLMESAAVPPGLQREAWTVRAHILTRRLQNPSERFLGFFRDEALRGQITDADERQGGLDMKALYGKQMNAAFSNPGVASGVPPPRYRPLTGTEMDARTNRVRRYYEKMSQQPGGKSQRDLFREVASEKLGRDVRDMPHQPMWEELMRKESGESRKNITEPPVPSRRARGSKGKTSPGFSSMGDVIDVVLPQASEEKSDQGS